MGQPFDIESRTVFLTFITISIIHKRQICVPMCGVEEINNNDGFFLYFENEKYNQNIGQIF